MEQIKQIWDQISAEEATHKMKMSDLQAQIGEIRILMSEETDQFARLKQQLFAKIRQTKSEIKDARNANQVDVYLNNNVTGETFDWNKVVRVPRPKNLAGMNLGEAGYEFFLNLPTDLKDELLLVGDDSPLPRVIDGALMVAGKDALGRNLTADDKREIRSAFRTEMREDRLATAQNRQHQVI